MNSATEKPLAMIIDSAPHTILEYGCIINQYNYRVMYAVRGDQAITNYLFAFVKPKLIILVKELQDIDGCHIVNIIRNLSNGDKAYVIMLTQESPSTIAIDEACKDINCIICKSDTEDFSEQLKQHMDTIA